MVCYRDGPDRESDLRKEGVMNELTEREHLVAEQYCKGLADKEVAIVLHRSEWTIKAQKRDIYKKLGISKDTELVLYMLCEKMRVDFDLREIRKHGLEIFFAILFMLMAVMNYRIDMRMQMRGIVRTARVIRRTQNRNEL